MTTGGCSTPSIRGIEKPHTSASITATSWPRWARATARLVVTDDLPTPPLPDAISSTRVVLSGSANGMARPSAWPWAAWLPAVAAGSPCSFSRSVARSSSVITPKERSTSVDPDRRRARSVTRDWISLRSGHPATVRVTSSATGVAVDAHVAHHVEVDDGAVQLGVLDGSEGGDDVVDGDGHGVRAPGQGDFHYGHR